MSVSIRTSMASAIAISVSLAAHPASAQDAENESDVRVDEIIVTGSPIARAQAESVLGVSVVDEDELQRRLANTIGETLRREPGVSSTFFGAGASRPIVRGQGGPRVRVLDSGIGSIDASVASPDHAVAIDPATAERVEIIRGPATLRYGSSAAGGVVNIFSNKIARELPEDGNLRIGGSTVDDGVEAAGGANVLLAPLGDGALVLHGSGFYRDADDFDIPGFAESARFIAAEEAEGEEEEEEEEEVFGTAENSAFETVGGSAGLSWTDGESFFGVSLTRMSSDYGIPGGHEEGEEEEEEEEEEEGGVMINLEQRRIDVEGRLAADLAIFQAAQIRFGYADYDHVEVEPSGEVGTTFTNEGWEGRFELIQKESSLLGGALNGAIGVQFLDREFSAIGEEAFVPPTESTQFGIFVFEELRVGSALFDLGGRFESTEHEVSESGVTRDFDSFSVSGGVGFNLSDNFFVGASAHRTERAPSTEELFSNGPHLATDQFEVGDPDLDEEVARGIEASARYNGDRFTLGVNGFYTNYKDFIFEAETGEIEDGLSVFQFTAVDAEFRGVEVEAEAELFQIGAFDIHADGQVSFVRATADIAADEDLPRIPPLSALIGLTAGNDWLEARAELDFAGQQDHIAEFELPTDGYQVVNLYATMRPFQAARGLSVRLALENVGDEEARVHSSFIKDLTPLPGRNFKIALRGEF